MEDDPARSFILAKPPKPPNQMTVEERRKWAEEIVAHFVANRPKLQKHDLDFDIARCPDVNELALELNEFLERHSKIGEPWILMTKT